MWLILKIFLTIDLLSLVLYLSCSNYPYYDNWKTFKGKVAITSAVVLIVSAVSTIIYPLWYLL